MNIAFYYTYPIHPTVGGTERVTYVIAEELKNYGIQSIFIAQKRRLSDEEDSRQFYLPNHYDLLSIENIDFIRKLLADNDIKVLINQDSFDNGAYLCSREYFSSVKCITAIHYNLYGAPRNVKDSIRENYIAGNSSRCKYLIQTICIPYYRYNALRNRTIMLKNIYDNVDNVVVLSQSDKNMYPVVDKKKIEVITNPLTLQHIGDFELKKENRVLWVGRMVFSQKRVDRLLKVWAIVEKNYPEWHLDLLGDGPCKTYYENMATSLKLHNVHFEGNKPPLEYYKRAKVFCLTSSYEGFGLVLTEAMQEGTIPVAFRSYDAIEEIITNGKNGILIKAFNIRKFAGELMKLMKDKNTLNTMSRAAIESVGKFSRNNIGDTWAQLLTNIISTDA